MTVPTKVVVDCSTGFVSEIPLTDEEMITNNIALIKSLFFPSKNRFFILGNEYIIGESKYIPPYVPSLDTNILLENVDSHKHKIQLFYTNTV